MKTIKTIFYVLIILQTATFIFADTDPTNPAKTKKPCGFPDDMNCFENRQIADAEMVNANYKALLERIQELTQIVCSYNPNHKICPDTQRIFRNSLGMTFMRIPAGTFMMGSPEDEPDREPILPGRGRTDETQHEVTISNDFFMQTTEITQLQWKTVMGDNPSYYSECGDNCPVEHISWDDVHIFIDKLNNRNEGTYRLPTEAEWEYTARAGTQTPYFFGECLSDSKANCNFSESTNGCPIGELRGKTIFVASFFPNAWGIYDMHGNVWEWCQDWYGQYPTTQISDPTGPSSGSLKVYRGGSWDVNANRCRSAFRNRWTSDIRAGTLGARLVYSP